MPLFNRIQQFLRPKPSPSDEKSDDREQTEDPDELILLKRVLRRRVIFKFIVSSIPYISGLLILAGFVGAFILPTDLLARGTYISENAIQPGQVNTYWSWSQVNDADKYADQVDSWRHLPSNQRAQAIQSAFELIGLPAQTQSYTFTSSASRESSPRSSIANGTNVHAILHAPRTDGSEALVLMASWLTRRPGSDIQGKDVNVRGVASVLALAKYLMSLNVWSKDIIFLIADGYIHGTHAWLQAYHDFPQSNLKTDRLKIRTGPIWAALNIDYPYHSFSHIGIHYEGINGQLPNLDLINAAANIIRWTGSCPVSIHDGPVINQDSLTPWKAYVQAGRTMLTQLSYGIPGMPSGPEGVFTPYRIDAISLFAVPAQGPHGFHTIGRVVESSLRSLNNLLERLHQSFFLYLLQSDRRFVSVGNYLLVPLLIAIGLTLLGLRKWGDKDVSGPPNKGFADSKQKEPPNPRENKGRAIVWCLKTVVVCHFVGAASFWMVMGNDQFDDLSQSARFWGVGVALMVLPLFLVWDMNEEWIGWVHAMLQALHLLWVGCVISVAAVVNFGLGAGLALSLGPPLALRAMYQGRGPVAKLMNRLSMAWWMSVDVAVVWLGTTWMKEMVMNGVCLGGWFMGFAFVIIIPILLVGSVVGFIGMKV